ncbi:MAG TPA: response regulator transcription factor [Gemmatimonadaceae bacterium]
MITDTIRVLLADDHLVVRAGLRALLRSAHDMVVIGEAANGREAVEIAGRLRPDVVVMDLSMAELDGVAATKEIVGAGIPTKVLVLTMHGEEEYLVDALGAGAAGYLVKSAAERELVDAIRAVVHGDVYVQPAAARVLARGVRHPNAPADDQARLQRLTGREREVLRLVAEGYSAAGIGERLFISPKTVDTYKQRITEKLGLAGRPDYVRFALRAGLLPVDVSTATR